MAKRIRRLACGFVLAAGLAGTGPAWAQSTLDDPDCSPTDEAKGGLCGHALAEIEKIEAGLLLAPGPITLEATDDTDVTHCFLDFEILTTTKPKSITGSNTLSVTSRVDGLTQMTLDFDTSNMQVDAVRVNGATAVYTRPTNKIAINLGGTYNVGQSFTVQVVYHGSPKNRADGFTFDFFDTQINGSDLIAASFSQPFYARYWWPCKDNIVTNTDKFTMDMHVTVPGTMTVAANGLLQGVDTLSGSRKKFRWHESYPIVTYLVSFAATNYTKITQYYNHAGGAMPVEFYIYPDQVSLSQSFLPTVVQAIATFSLPSLYGEYPFINEKYGIAQFQWCCGMEHQTMTSQGSFTSENRNVHELAHQWWGDSIACATWHDIWLNEGFARFSEALFKQQRPGGSDADYIAHLNANRPATSGTGTVYRYDISTTSAIFSTAYSYNKGAWVVHMLRNVMGDSAFFAALAAYRAAYEGGSADTEQFRAVCEAVYGADLGWFFNEWVYNAGAPYYRFGWDTQQIAGGNWVRLHVEQYQKTVVSSFPAAMKMPIDVTLTTAGGTTTHRVWNDAAASGSTATQWFVLPADGSVTAVQFDKDTKILRGAATPVAYVPGPPKLLSMSPSPGATVSAFPGVTSILLHFSEPVTAAANDFSVVGGISGTQSFTLNLDGTGLMANLFFGDPLPNGQTFSVQVADSLAGQVSGLALDGEVTTDNDPAALPSGDGSPGGSATLVFSIAGFAPDLDHDNDVDAADMTLFQNCLTGPGQTPIPTGCGPVDFDADLDVDQSDFGYFQRCLGEENVMPAQTCMGS